MIRARDDMQGRERSKVCDDGLEQIQLGECIALTRNEEHRDPDCGKMIGTFDTGLSCGMEWEAQEREAADTGQWFDRLSLRSHPAAERSPSGDERQFRREFQRFCGCGANSRMRDPWRVRPLRALFHVGKLIAKRRDAACGEALRVGLHRLVPHSGACAMREQVKRFRAGWPE